MVNNKATEKIKEAAETNDFVLQDHNEDVFWVGSYDEYGIDCRGYGKAYRVPWDELEDLFDVVPRSDL